MSDLISRSALIARLGINEDCMKCKHANRSLCKLCADEACEAICDAPAVDAKPVKHGKWIDKGDYAICSECGGDSGTQYDGIMPIPRYSNYCPNCGAKMDEVEE